MSLIGFQQAILRSGIDTGDLSYLDTIPEASKYYHLTTPGRGGTAVVHTIPVPAGSRFVIISASVLKSGGTSTGNFRAYFDLRFGGTTFDRIWFDDSQSPKTRESTYSHSLIGNGTSAIQIVRRSATENAEVVILGYYRDNADIVPSGAVQNLTAVERSPDDIRLDWDAPLNTGGAPVIGYRIRRGDTLAAGQVTNFMTIEDNTGSAVTRYDDTSLADNTVYYYQVIPLTEIGDTIRPGIASSVVSARTDIDHPGPATDLAATPQTSTSIGLAWVAPTDTGGTSIRGYRIERAETQDQVWRNYDPANDDLTEFETENGVDFPDFAELVADTGDASTSYTDDMLIPNTVYFYRVRAINAEQTSLIDSNIAGGFVQFTGPANLRHTIASDGTSVTILWDAATDTGGRTVEGYHIERSLNNVTFVTLAADTGSIRTNYTDPVNGGTIYHYRVSAIAGGIEGPPSTSITVTVPPRPPSAPPNLAARAVTESRIGLTWQTPADNGGLPITGYDLERSTNIGFPDGTGPEETFDQSADPAAAIDGVADVPSTITVPAESDFPIGHVIIDVDVTHTYRGDLSVILTAPDGSMFTLKAVDFTDRAEDIMESYSGDLLNDLIGTQSVGDWRLNVRDEFGALDHGVFNSWRIRIVRAVEPLMVFDLGLVNEFLDSGLTPETQYFYRIRAKHNTEDGDYSNITNATTPPSLFGNAHDGDLNIALGETVIIDEHREYGTVRINDGGTLRVNAAVIQGRVLETLGTGKVIVDMTGCAGGTAGFTSGGAGGAGGPGARPFGQNVRDHIPLPGEPGSNPVLISPHTASACTSEVDAEALSQLFGEVEQFIETFTNRIRGGMGSDGTAAAISGNGGHGGNGGVGANFRGNRRQLVGGSGGSGGTGAQGASGVMGGGKAALMFQQITENPSIAALGIAGNDGQQGTAAPGNQGGVGQSQHLVFVTPTNGSAGAAASGTGTLGSEGSQGGIVYLLYENLALGSIIQFLDDDFSTNNGGFTSSGATSNVQFLSAPTRLEIRYVGSFLTIPRWVKTYNLNRAAGDTTILSIEFLTSIFGAVSAINAPGARITLFDDDTGVELGQINPGGIALYPASSSGRQQFSQDVTELLGAATNVRFEFSTHVSGNIPAGATTRLLLFRALFEVAETDFDARLSDDVINVTGGQGGRSGTAAGEAEQFLADRVPDGADGFKFISRLADLAT